MFFFQAQISAAHQYATQQYGYPSANASVAPASGNSNIALYYPSLMDEYMGLRLEPPSGPIAPPTDTSQQVATRPAGAVSIYGGTTMVAPLTGDNNVGLMRAQVTHGIREVILCKDGNGKVGMKLRDVNKVIFDTSFGMWSRYIT